MAVLHRSPARFPCRSEWLGLREDKPSARNRVTQGPRDPVGIRRCPSAAGCPGRPSAEPAGPRWHRCSRLGSGGRSPQLGQRVFSTDAWGLASQSATASPLSPGPRQTGTDMGCEPEAGACEAQPASPNGHESTDQGFQVSGLNWPWGQTSGAPSQRCEPTRRPSCPREDTAGGPGGDGRPGSRGRRAGRGHSPLRLLSADAPRARGHLTHGRPVTPAGGRG